MTITAEATITHETTVFDYTTAPHPVTNETTWWGYTCTCGKEEKGVDEQFAHDLAYTHTMRTATCTCANPTITITYPSYNVVATGTCDCGYSEITYLRRTEPSARERVTRTATNRLARHRCHPLAGHAHDHDTPTTTWGDTTWGD